MEGPESRDLVLVDQQVLPEVLCGCSSQAEPALRRSVLGRGGCETGRLSRSAFYKYKDAVFPYDAGRTRLYPDRPFRPP